MRTSLQKLLEGYRCFPKNIPPAPTSVYKNNRKWHDCVIAVIGTRSLSMSDYLVGLESSGWLRHIKSVVDAAVFLTKVIFFFVFKFIGESTELLLKKPYTYGSGWSYFFSKLSLLPFGATPGCDGRGRQCAGSLFRWLGQNSSGLLSGGTAHGPLLPHYQGLHGKDTYHYKAVALVDIWKQSGFLPFNCFLGIDWERLDLIWSQICRQVRLWILQYYTKGLYEYHICSSPEMYI